MQGKKKSGSSPQQGGIDGAFLPGNPQMQMWTQGTFSGRRIADEPQGLTGTDGIIGAQSGQSGQSGILGDDAAAMVYGELHAKRGVLLGCKDGPSGDGADLISGGGGEINGIMQLPQPGMPLLAQPSGIKGLQHLYPAQGRRKGGRGGCGGRGRQEGIGQMLLHQLSGLRGRGIDRGRGGGRRRLLALAPQGGQDDHTDADPKHHQEALLFHKADIGRVKTAAPG